jgi:hypothetical protein
MTDVDWDEPSSAEQPPPPELPAGYIGVSAAIDQLARGMWTGHPAARPVVKARAAISRIDRPPRLTFEAWIEAAAKSLHTAAIDGRLPIHVCAPGAGIPEAAQDAEIAQVPGSVIERLLLAHGRIPDRPIHPTLKTTGGDERLFGLLNRGGLCIRKKDFARWYARERQKGRWPSQPTKQKVTGRPSKQTAQLITWITDLVERREWDASQSVPALRLLLQRAGYAHLPSVSTLKRMLDMLFVRTGDTAFRRTHRRRNRTNRSKAPNVCQ